MIRKRFDGSYRKPLTLNESWDDLIDSMRELMESIKAEWQGCLFILLLLLIAFALVVVSYNLIFNK